MSNACPDPTERKPGQRGRTKRKRQGVAKEVAIVVEARRYQIARYRLAHPMMPLTMVAKELGIHYETVKNDAEAILRQYQERHREFTDDLVPILAAYYWDTIEKAEAGYERSLRAKIRKSVKERTSATGAQGTAAQGATEKSVQEEEREGNPVWLELRARALASLKELYGAAAPAQVNLNLSTQDPLRVLMTADPAARKARAQELATQISRQHRADAVVDAEFNEAHNA